MGCGFAFPRKNSARPPGCSNPKSDELPQPMASQSLARRCEASRRTSTNPSSTSAFRPLVDTRSREPRTFRHQLHPVSSINPPLVFPPLPGITHPSKAQPSLVTSACNVSPWGGVSNHHRSFLSSIARSSSSPCSSVHEQMIMLDRYAIA
jgi:hypothetical protein